jgi:dipeptidyl aminopeptidase/acylaminoacyl peptidase
MGGMVGARVLAKAKAESFKAAVFWSSVSQPGALLDESYEHAGTMLDLGGWLVSRAFMRQYAEVKPLEELAKAKLSTRVLLIHGTDDEHVPLEHSMDYQRAFEAVGAKVALNVIEGATHTYETIEQDREVVQRTVRWLVRNL